MTRKNRSGVPPATGAAAESDKRADQAPSLVNEARAIPFSALLRDDGGIRNALMVLGENHVDPKLRQALVAELMPIARKGVRFRAGRLPGSRSKEVNYIHQLARSRRALSAKALFRIADKAIIGKMSERVFANHVSMARNKATRE
jgi:hypothetical protein